VEQESLSVCRCRQNEGFVAPTGRYTPGASDNIGSGYWGNNIGTGSTVYLTKNKATTANLFTNWEIHGSKETGNGTTLTPGQAFTMEWGFGQILPLKKAAADGRLPREGRRRLSSIAVTARKYQYAGPLFIFDAGCSGQRRIASTA
jgi:hypothetical protein